MMRVYHSISAAVVKSLAFFQNRPGADRKQRRVSARRGAVVDHRLVRTLCFVPAGSLLATSSFYGSRSSRILFRSSLWRLLVLGCAFLIWPLAAWGQNIQYTANSASLGLRGDFKINPLTHALEMQIQLGQGAYPQRGGSSDPTAISYSSRAWRMAYVGTEMAIDPISHQPYPTNTLIAAKYAEHSRSGWTFSLGNPIIDNSSLPENYDHNGSPSSQCTVGGEPDNGHSCCFIDRLRIIMTDGSMHEFRSTDQPICYTGSGGAMSPTPPDDLYSVDGSRMHYNRSTNTLYLPDGSFWTMSDGSYFDRNGNRLLGAGGDTLGRSLPNPLANNGTDYTTTVPGVGGNLIYTFHWRNLSQVLTTSQTLPSFSDSSCLRYGSGCSGQYLFTSDTGYSPGHPIYVVNGQPAFDPVVLYQIELPHDPANQNPPTYTFTYNKFAEIDRVTYPTGAYEKFAYAQNDSNPNGSQAYAETNRGVTDRWVSAKGDGSDEVHWQYAGTSSDTAPDLTLTARTTYQDMFGSRPWSYGDSREKMPTEESVFVGSQLLRRKLTQWDITGSNWSGNGPLNVQQYANRDARVSKEVEIVLDTGTGNALAKTTVHNYDTTYEFSVGAIETSVNEYDWVVLDQNTAATVTIGSIPLGNLLRTQETTNLILDPNISPSVRDAYRARNLVSLQTSTRVKDAAGNIVAQGSISYDEYSLMNIGSVASWTDPQTPYRGNATTMSHWLNTTNSYLQTHASYDQFGNVRTSTDANGNQSQVDYSSTYQYAYPTTMTTAVPDPSGQYGSNSAFTTTSVYDFNTGRVMSTRDANGQTTSYDYTDPLNRIKQVTAPNGGHVRYNYSDTPGDLYVQVLADEDASRSIETRRYFDNMGRAVRGFLYDGTPSTPWSVTDTYYDNMGRVSQVSNPYRVSSPGASVPATCSVCTTSAYDALGRVTTVTTPDGAHVTSAYAASTTGTLGTTVTVTDQAGRQRRSLTDSLGRLARVDEPDKDTGSLGDVSSPVQPTSYAYDVLGNLRQVTQGSQQRFFTYDSLSRLLRARNPEQLVNGNLNLTDPVTGNSQWSMAYTYDANGNLLTRTDARSVVTTYGYDSLNRNRTTTYTNDAANTPTVSRYYDGWRDGYNNSITNSKGKLWQTETAGATGTRTTIDGYDPMGRPQQQEQQFNTGSGWSAPYITSQTYDLGSHVRTENYPSGHKVTYNYDQAGRLGDLSVNQPDRAFWGNLGDGVERTYANQISYDAASRPTGERFGSDKPLFQSLGYNSRGQLYIVQLGTSLGNWNRGMLVNDYGTGDYTAWGTGGTDNNGNLIRSHHYIPTVDQNDQINGWSLNYQDYTYDYLNRLSSVTETSGHDTGGWFQAYKQSYIYDRYGNRTIDQANTTGAGINNKQFSVEPGNNRLYAPGETEQNHSLIDYDPAGNQKKDYYSDPNGVHFDRLYDAENRMISSNGTSFYTYNADGQRVRRKVDGVETWQIYGIGGELLAEYAASASAATPQKEYGYRNGQLLITADAATASAPAPSGLAAAASGTFSVPTVTLNWSAASGATNYRVERKGANGNYTLAGTTSSTTLTDTGVTAANAYLYKVCAADGSGNCTSAYTNIALGTAMIFTDPTIISIVDDPSGANVTVVKLEHITELRTAVNAVRHLAGQPDAGWTHPNLQRYVSEISKDDVQDLRDKLHDALLALGIQESAYEDATLYGAPSGTLIKKIHITQLRQRVTSGLGGSGGGGGTAVNIQWLVADQLGTPRMIFDKTGSLENTKRHDYLPFGEELTAGQGLRAGAQGYSADSIRQKFTQKERDNETSLDYFLARYYSSTQGRFTSPDEFTGGPDELYEFEESASDNPTFYAELADPQSLNKYQYAYNNPLRFIDPDGHQIRQTVSNILYTGGDFVEGVVKGAVSSVSFGYAGGPRSNDSVANRLGQSTGSSLLLVAGTTGAGGGGGLIIVTDGAAALSPAVDVVTLAGAVLAIGSAKNLHALATTPMQTSDTSSGSKPRPVEGSSSGPGSGKRPSESTKDAVRARDNNTCVHCGSKTTRTPGPRRSNIDHADPKSRGGDTTMRNLQNSCDRCNKQKGAKTNAEYQKWKKNQPQ